MSPGRELDALVAEKVMGVSTEIVERGLSYEESKCITVRACSSRFLPHYSTNIAAAWEVVSEMADKGYLYALSPGVCNFCLLGTNTWTRGEGSAPHAICLAALKAVGHEQ
jgi:hypothetical protein